MLIFFDWSSFSTNEVSQVIIFFITIQIYNLRQYSLAIVINTSSEAKN